MRTATAANVVRLPSQRPVKLDDGPATVALVGREIFRSGRTYASIAADAGLCLNTVMFIAQGETKKPALRTIISILTALGWEVWASEGQR